VTAGPVRRFDCLTVFNALSSQDLLLGIGQVLRLVAAAPGALEEYERSQTLSAYSVVRLLAAEQAAEVELLADTRRGLEDVLAADDRPPVRQAAERIRQAADGIAVGDALSELLAALAPEDRLRPGLHAVLAEMVDREVQALAAAPR
jgi:hypothetical protein